MISRHDDCLCRYAQVLQWLVDNGWEWNQDDMRGVDVHESVIVWARAKGYPVDRLGA